VLPAPLRYDQRERVWRAPSIVVPEVVDVRVSSNALALCFVGGFGDAIQGLSDLGQCARVSFDEEFSLTCRHPEQRRLGSTDDYPVLCRKLYNEDIFTAVANGGGQLSELRRSPVKECLPDVLFTLDGEPTT
jgi:hypothetical protein